jgi:hypothetical protein
LTDESMALRLAASEYGAADLNGSDVISESETRF